MIETDLWSWFAALALGFGGSYAMTPLSARVATRFGILDAPDTTHAYKRQAQPTPYLGGVAILSGVLLGALFVSLIALIDLPAVFVRSYLPVIGIALTLAVVGLVDDVRGLPRSLRLGLQVAAAFGAWAVGFRVLGLPWAWADFLVTIIWIVGITNAFNLLDNMDGLSAGLAGIGALSFAVMGLVEELSVLSVVAAALAGASFGFLAHNRHPAKIYMGDSGSLFLGFLLAVIGIRLRFDNLQEVTFLVPVVALGIPIFDTTLVVISRLRNGKPVFSGNRDHASHRLVAIGLPVKVAVGFLYFAGLCLGWIALAISRANLQVGWLLLTLVLMIGAFFGRLMWAVPVYAEASSKTDREENDAEEIARTP